MMTQTNRSDFIIFADESGDTGIRQIDPNYPVFLLNFCVFRRDEYVKVVEPSLRVFKVAYLGNDQEVLHWHRIRRRQPPFDFGGDEEKQADFERGLNELIDELPFTVIVAVIYKNDIQYPLGPPYDLYELALEMCLRQAHDFLAVQGQDNLITRVVIEARSKKQNKLLNRAFQRFCAQYGQATPLTCFEMVFAGKLSNDAGLQIADRTAHPVGRHSINPAQPNWAWDRLVEPRLYRGPLGEIDGYGLSKFPT